MLGVFVWDLYISGLNVDTTDSRSNAAKWVSKGFASGPKLFFCDQAAWNPSFFGGPGVITSTSQTMERTYAGLASHDIIYYSLTVALVGVWQPSDSFTIQIDNNPPKTYNPSGYSSLFVSMNCGTPLTPSYIALITGKRFHTASMVTVRISFSISSSVSFGIKDLTMSFAAHKPSDANEELYAFNAATNYLVSTGCPYYKYMDGTGNCQPCNSPCFMCFGPSITDCFAPHATGYFDGASFLMPVYPCIFGDTNPNKCVVCDHQYVLDIDDTCKLSCTASYIPFYDGNAKKCMIPCPSGTYRQLDDTCSGSCNSPLIKVANRQEVACTTPCGESINEFLNYNGTCVTSCQYHTVNINNNRICVPCVDPDLYRYDNGTCLPTCQIGFTSSTMYEYKFCATGGYTPELKDIAASSSLMNSIGGNLAKLSSLLNFRNPSALYLGAFIDMLDYIKYLNITYPPKLQVYIDMQNELSFNILPDPPDRLSVKFPNAPLPLKFEQYGLAASFFLNYWSNLLTLGPAFVVLILIYLIKCSTEKFKLIQKVCAQIISSLKWNFIVISLLSSYSQVVLYTSMELRTTQFNNKMAVFSFSLDIIINVVSILVLIKMFFLITRLQKTQKRRNLMEDACNMRQAKDSYRDYCIIFEDLKDSSAMQQAFTCIYCIYFYLFYAVIAYLFAYPMLQTTLHVVLTSFLLIYLIVCRPFREWVDTAKLIIQTMIILVINICVVAIANIGQDDADDVKPTYGIIIIISEMVFSGFALSQLAVSAMSSIVKLFRLIRDRHIRRSGLTGVRDIEIVQNQTQANAVRPTQDNSSLSPLPHDETSISDFGHNRVLERSNHTRNQISKDKRKDGTQKNARRLRSRDNI